MNSWIELITVIVEIGLTWYFLSGMFGVPRISKRRVIIFYVCYGVVLSCATLFIPLALLRILVIAATLAILSEKVYKKTWVEVAYAVLIFFVMATLADVICGGILTLMGISTDQLMGEGLVRLIYNGTGKIAHLALLYLVLTLPKARYDIRAIARSFPLIIGQVFNLAICLQNFKLLSFGISPLFITLETFGLLYISVIVCYYVETLKQSYEDKERAAKAEQMLEIQRNYYQNAIERQEETRALWHDIKKYLGAMEALVGHDKEEEAQRCFNDLQTSMIGIQDTVDVENAIVNSILTYGVERARSMGAKLDLDVWVGDELNILPSDLFIIIGNTIDNSIEACSGLHQDQDRIIKVTLHQINHLLFYEIANPYAENIPAKSKMVHGYGLKNVEKCVQKNGGVMHCLKDKGYYTVTIHLNA